MDVWQYIAQEQIDIPELYFSHEREVFNRRGVWLADTKFVNRQEDEELERKKVRFRTIGDATCTGAVLSDASNIKEIIDEVASARQTERGNRHDDKRSETAMEDRKRLGYF
jgi:sulfate adenylyltransferase subunit 2